MNGRRKRKPEEHDDMELNYNDRLDGYGFGPSESTDFSQPYQKERRVDQEVSYDEFGGRNQYGPVDQYVFRDKYERRWSRPNKDIDDDDDWREWGRERYSNDDYSRYGGPDFRERERHGKNQERTLGHFEIGQEDQRLEHHHPRPRRYPGVSGKTVRGGSWFNRDKYEEQRNFIGRGPKGYRRSDDRIYEEVCETLMRSPDVDASTIGVRVHEGTVLLEGKVEDRHSKRMAEYVIEDLPGVLDVRNEIRVGRLTDEDLRGPDAAAKKDLGVGGDNLESRST